MHPIRHFKTITAHKLLVMKYCFRLGLYWQGLLHDLSKYSPVEFFVGARYWQGTCSPNNAERKATGVSRAWLHHKGRNKHHFEYWIDYAVGKDLNGENMPMVGMKMPEKYVAEMFCDRIAASQVYLGEQYTDRSPWEYYDKFKGHYLSHPETAAQLDAALRVLRDDGEDAAFAWVRKNLLGKS
jgi:hypothetical protein